MIDKEQRIEQKKAELMETFEELPEEQLKVARDLIGQAAFLAITLQDLAEIISKEGMTEEYTNGANQSGRKVSSNAKMYNSLIGKYNTIIGSLLKIVPPAKKPDKKTAYEIWQAERKADEKMFSDTVEYVKKSIDNAPNGLAEELENIWKSECQCDYVQAAKVFRERGL